MKMVNAINHPVCPMCGLGHPPGLLNCVLEVGTVLPGVGTVVSSEPMDALFDMDIWLEARGAMLEEASRKITALMLGAPPVEVTALEKLRAVRDQVQALFVEWRRERCDWEGLSEEILGSDESGTARWMYNVLTDLDELVMRHERAIVGVIGEE